MTDITRREGPLPPSQPRGGLPPGSLFASRYRIAGLLGRGGFGEVYTSRDERLERFVALKIVNRHSGTSFGRTDGLLAEARTVARLDHPHIVAVYDAGVEEGVPWIASRLVNGQSLQNILSESGPLTREEVLQVILATASALSHAHARKIVHRDVKPGNLLLERREDGTEHVWITDFGIARVLRETQETAHWIRGTPSYMAPEQVYGQSVDGRTDVFALGCVAAELLTGKRLFTGDVPSGVLRMIVHDEPSLAEVEERGGPGWARVIRRCIAKVPADRWQSMNELAAALRDLAGTPQKHRNGSRLGWAFRSQPQIVSDRPVVVEGVKKRYGFGAQVLDGVDLTIERGSVYALLGRNGCGKTTFLRTLLGIYRRDAGRISLFGHDPVGGNPRLFAKVGFVPDVLAVDERRRVREVLDFASRFYPRWDWAYCHRLLSRYDLPLEETIRKLSRGMQTKVSLVLALSYRPDLLVLDDPTLGLDAIVLAELVETLQVVRDEGVTLLLASHNHEEFGRLATHAGLFRNGRIEMSDRLDRLRRRVREMSPDLGAQGAQELSLREIFVRLLR
jgi:ABC-type multidrug transport system ATPase subunit